MGTVVFRQKRGRLSFAVVDKQIETWRGAIKAW